MTDYALERRKLYNHSPYQFQHDVLGIHVPDVAITDIKFSATNTFTMIDNFSYASIPGAEETPEPIGLVLGATGLAAIWLARRMRRFC